MAGRRGEESGVEESGVEESGVEELRVDERGIRLGQLLKLWGVVGSGGEAKAVLEAGEVQVGGRPETRRGAQLAAGDVVEYAGRRVRLV